MKRAFLMAPEYESQQDKVEEIIDRFDSSGDLVHEGRNTIKSFLTPVGRWNVKRYHVPILFNRIAYTFFRQPKGIRAFQYPERILDAGFETPRPVAYVEEREMGLISYSYFVSEECPYSRRFYEFGDARVEDCSEILTRFAQFTAGLHHVGIYHRDYSPGNILFDKIDGDWRFSIIDINRMEFGPVSISKGCANFARLWGQPEFFEFIAKVYARERHADEDLCVRLVMEARDNFWLPRRKHHDLPFTLRFKSPNK